MKDTIKKFDTSVSQAELDALFDAIDQNGNDVIEYEEFIEFVLSNDQVADLASQELGLLQLTVQGDLHDEETEIARILEETREAAEAKRLEELHLQEEVIQQALEASAREAAELSNQREAKRKEEEDQERMFLEMSRREAQQEADRKAKAQAAADEAELEAALKASEAAAAEHQERIKRQHEEEDGSDLFRAALRASCLDLGPRGVSQAAKVFATGDITIGQPKGSFDTTTSGARGRRGQSSVGAAPAYTGTEVAGAVPVAGRADSPGALKRQAEWAARANGGRASPVPVNGRASSRPGRISSKPSGR